MRSVPRSSLPPQATPTRDALAKADANLRSTTKVLAKLNIYVSLYPMTTTAATCKLPIKTGRRPNPTIDGPRDNTVCFMLSDNEKLAVDRLAFCLNITRSGLLAKIVVDFVLACETGKPGRDCEQRLFAYLEESRLAVKKRGKLATKFVTNPNQPGKP